jgi:hypothetical protein
MATAYALVKPIPRLLAAGLAVSLATAPAVASGAQGSWRPVGSAPLGDAAAKALVTPHAEIRPKNSRANHHRPSRSELSHFRRAVYRGGPDSGRRIVALNPLLKHVSGRFSGTTDEIIQWGALKWGIPEDVLRAVAVRESDWHQGRTGDRRDGVNARRYPKRSRIDSDSVYESLGLMQIKWRANGSLNPGTEPLRWKSTAFNVDYAAASIRYYYDGRCTWCRPGYRPGQAWESIGAHYSPSPWRNADMLDYIASIQDILSKRAWEQPGF